MARKHSAQNTANTTITTTTETVVATVPGLSTRDGGETVSLVGTVQVTIGTTGSALTPRLRRGTTATDTLVGEGNPVSATAGDTVTVTIQADDVPGEVAGQSYVLTVQQTAATGNGSALFAAVEALVGT